MTAPVSSTWAPVLQHLIEKLEAFYVFPETARQIKAQMLARLAKGEYDRIDTAEQLCTTINGEMQAVANDRHLRLRLRHGTPRGHMRMTPEEIEDQRKLAADQNYGFHKVERLAGNVGYIDLRGLLPTDWAGDTAVAAMSLLGNTSALIFDLRNCPGGSPAMIALLQSYLFQGPTHLNNFYVRQGDTTTQSWTLPYVPGKRDGQKPVYVLTSRSTFSGAEEFAYNLKNLKRGILVGEVTGGGANPGANHMLDEHFEIFISSARAYNPITGTNWEGVGVEPDIAVASAEALTVAHVDALKKILASQEGREDVPAKALATEVGKALASLVG